MSLESFDPKRPKIAFYGSSVGNVPSEKNSAYPASMLEAAGVKAIVVDLRLFNHFHAADHMESLATALAEERARADRAEKERDELRRQFGAMSTQADAWGYAVRALERADHAEAALATARSERDEARVCSCTFGPDGEQCANCARISNIIRRAAEEARGSALREAAGVCEVYARENGWSDGQASPGTRRTQSARHGAAMQCRERILALIGASEEPEPTEPCQSECDSRVPQSSCTARGGKR